MNFRLFLYKKHDADITLEDVIEHVKNMQYVIRVGESTWFYSNPGTRAYFEYQINDDNEYPEYDEYEYTGISCSVNFTTNEKKRIECFKVIEKLIDQFDLYVTIPFITEDPEQFEKDVLFNCFNAVNQEVLKQTNYNLNTFYIDKQNDEDTTLKQSEKQMVEKNYAELDEDLFNSLLYKRKISSLIKIIVITIAVSLFFVFTKFNAVLFFILYFIVALIWVFFISYHKDHVKNLNDVKKANLYNKLLVRHIRKVDKDNKVSLSLKFRADDKFGSFIKKNYKVLSLVQLDNNNSNDRNTKNIYIIMGNENNLSNIKSVDITLFDRLNVQSTKMIDLPKAQLDKGEGYIIPVVACGVSSDNRLLIKVTSFDKLYRGYYEKMLCIRYDFNNDIWLESFGDISKYQKEWVFTGATSNYKFKVEGIDIFKQEWKGTGQRISVRDPLYNKPYDFDIFYIEKDNKLIMFALGMFANGIFGVYVKK